jgi:hypothetical protein
VATVNPIFTWVRLAQRIPVRIHIDEVPPGVVLAAGMTATVQIDDRPSGAGEADIARRPISACNEDVERGRGCRYLSAPQLRRVGATGDDQVFAIDEAVRSRRIGRAGQWHRERALAHIVFISYPFSVQPFGDGRRGLLAAVLRKIEDEDTLEVCRSSSVR